MRIAILMSTYNGEKYLSEQLESIARQTVVNQITVYIRDDGSYDNTDKIVESYRDKMEIVLYKEANQGPARSFWTLLCKDIEADYYLFCDQDDIWDSDKVERSIERLKNGACLVACNCRIIDSNGNVVQEKRLDNVPVISIPRIFVAGFTQGCSMAFVKEVRDYVIKCGLKCIPMHDVIVLLYALSLGKVEWIDKPLFSYRIHGSNVVAKNNSIKKRIKTTVWNWKNSACYSMSDVAWELLQYGMVLSDEDVTFLRTVSYYRESFRNKLALLFLEDIKGIESGSLRSFRIRLLMNMF